MSYALNIMVVDKDTGKGRSGHKVKLYNKPEVRTDKSGRATLIVDGSTANVYVDGFEVYNGSCSKAPNPILVRK